MLSHYILRALTLTTTVQATTLLPVHNITRSPENFENLAVRSNGQILTTTTMPNASIYQVDPLGILPLTLVHTIPDVKMATGIAEGKTPDVFYVASGTVNITQPFDTFPDTYSITELDMRGVSVFPNGSLTSQPLVKRAASLPGASLLNGIAFARRHSDHLLVADSFRGLIWNVNVCSGEVGVTLNDTTTKGTTALASTFTGVNGLKVHEDMMYWTSTGTNKMYKVAVDEFGWVREGKEPELVAENLTCDDLVLDCRGNAYVAGSLNVITRVTPDGEKEIVAGTFNSTDSDLGGPSALRFGRLESDRWSLYVTENGGLFKPVPSSKGVSRIDLDEAYGLA